MILFIFFPPPIIRACVCDPFFFFLYFAYIQSHIFARQIEKVIETSTTKHTWNIKKNITVIPDYNCFNEFGFMIIFRAFFRVLTFIVICILNVLKYLFIRIIEKEFVIFLKPNLKLLGFNNRSKYLLCILYLVFIFQRFVIAVSYIFFAITRFYLRF